MELEEARKRIDEIDKNVSRLLAERFELSKAIGEEKKRLGLPVLNSKREEKVLENVTKNLTQEAKLCIIEVYNSILKASKKLQ